MKPRRSVAALFVASVLCTACADDAATGEELDERSSDSRASSRERNDAGKARERRDGGAKDDERPRGAASEDDDELDEPEDEALAGDDAMDGDDDEPATDRDAGAHEDAGLRSDASAMGDAGANGGADGGARTDASSEASGGCSTLTFESYGKEVLAHYCARCHSGEEPLGRFPFDTLADVKLHEVALREQVIEQRTMPPGAAKPAMTDADRKKFGEWLACGPN